MQSFVRQLISNLPLSLCLTKTDTIDSDDSSEEDDQESSSEEDNQESSSEEDDQETSGKYSEIDYEGDEEELRKLNTYLTPEKLKTYYKKHLNKESVAIDVSKIKNDFIDDEKKNGFTRKQFENGSEIHSKLEDYFKKYAEKQKKKTNAFLEFMGFY